MGTPLNVAINGVSVLHYLKSCKIRFQYGDYCGSVDLELAGLDLWSQTDPVQNFGELIIQVFMGDQTFQFLCEERSCSDDRLSMSIWGRTKQALLSFPYSKLVNDTDDTNNIWQIENTTPSGIISYLMTNFASEEIIVNWNVDDFVIYKDTLSVSNQSIIEVIDNLANIIGAVLLPKSDGSIDVNYYETSTAEAVIATYDDIEDIVSSSEQITSPSGYNAVTVYGYSSDKQGKNEKSLSIDGVYDSTGEKASTVYVGQTVYVKVYYYCSDGSEIYSYAADSSGDEINSVSVGGGVETITEKVILIFGEGKTKQINTDGDSAVRGDTSIPVTVQTVTYDAYYERFAVSGLSEGDNYFMVFFDAEKNANTTINAQEPEPPDGGGGGDKCSSVKVEQISATEFKVYGSSQNNVDLSGGATYQVKETGTEPKNDQLVFSTDQYANTSYPIYSVTWNDYPGSLSWKMDTTKVRISYNPPEVVNIQYQTRYVIYEFSGATGTVSAVITPPGCTPTAITLDPTMSTGNNISVYNNGELITAKTDKLNFL